MTTEASVITGMATVIHEQAMPNLNLARPSLGPDGVCVIPDRQSVIFSVLSVYERGEGLKVLVQDFPECTRVKIGKGKSRKLRRNGPVDSLHKVWVDEEIQSGQEKSWTVGEVALLVVKRI